MKISKNTTGLICDMLTRHSDVSQKEIIDIIKESEERPDAIMLLEREYKRTASRLAAQIRDADNTRLVFAVRGGSGASTSYINMDLTGDTAKLDKIYESLNKIRIGVEKSIGKNRANRALIEGQIRLDDLKNV